MAPKLDYKLVHTGQHYDDSMSGAFFKQLNIPLPDVNLEAGGSSQAEQTTAIMVRFEKNLLESPADLVVVVGDVTSTLACSIVARKLRIKVANVEGGIRSGDMSMPEEINRIETDSISDYFFTTTQNANSNLQKEGKTKEQLFLVGNTMIDTLNSQLPFFRKPSFWQDFHLHEKKHIVMTLHRPANVDKKEQFKSLLVTIENSCNGVPVIFPVHPRTRNNMEKFGIRVKNIKMAEPLAYLEFNYLVKNAMGVITDSGGITEETTVMKVACITLRDTTERPETVSISTNELEGYDYEKISNFIKKMISSN